MSGNEELEQAEATHPAAPSPGLAAARKKQAELRANGIPVVHLDPLEKAKRNPTSLRTAVTAKCYDCVGQDQDPNWRKSVGECSVKHCPLHQVRPFQNKAEQE